MNKISCFIVTKNEVANISSCINCVKSFVSEIIVVDTGSNDETVKIAKSLGAKIFKSEANGANVFAESLCENEWILNLEPDEELSQELQREISIVAESGLIEKYKAYKINFAIPYYKQANKRKLGPSNKLVRLYNKNYAHYDEDGVLKVNKGTETFKFLYPAFYKIDITVAEFMNKSGYNFSKVPFILRVFALFFMAFFVKRYFIYGFKDVFLSAIYKEHKKDK